MEREREDVRGREREKGMDREDVGGRRERGREGENKHLLVMYYVLTS